MLDQLQGLLHIPFPHGIDQLQVVLVGLLVDLLVEVHAGGADGPLKDPADLLGQILVARKLGHGHVKVVVHAAEVLIGDLFLPAVLPQR